MKFFPTADSLLKVWDLMMEDHPRLYQSHLSMESAKALGYTYKVLATQAEPSNIAIIWHMFSNGMIAGDMAVIQEDRAMPYVCCTHETDAVTFRFLQASPHLEEALDRFAREIEEIDQT